MHLTHQKIVSSWALHPDGLEGRNTPVSTLLSSRCPTPWKHGAMFFALQAVSLRRMSEIPTRRPTRFSNLLYQDMCMMHCPSDFHESLYERNPHELGASSLRESSFCVRISAIDMMARQAQGVINPSTIASVLPFLPPHSHVFASLSCSRSSQCSPHPLLLLRPTNRSLRSKKDLQVIQSPSLNNGASMNGLPKKVFEKILIEAIQPDTEFEPTSWQAHVQLTAVCKVWRDDLLDCPEFLARHSALAVREAIGDDG